MFYSARVFQAGVATTNPRAKEFEEAAAGARAHDADKSRTAPQMRHRPIRLLLFRRPARSCDALDM